MSKLKINRNPSIAGGTAATATNGTGLVRGANATAGLEVIFDVTTAPGVDSVTCSVYARDDISGKRVLLLASTTRTATGTERLKIFPGLTAAANVAANDVIGDNYEVEVAHVGVGSFQYTVAVSELSAGA